MANLIKDYKRAADSASYLNLVQYGDLLIVFFLNVSSISLSIAQSLQLHKNRIQLYTFSSSGD